MKTKSEPYIVNVILRGVRGRLGVMKIKLWT